VGATRGQSSGAVKREPAGRDTKTGTKTKSAGAAGAAGGNGLPRGPQALPRETVAAHQRERLFKAMVQAVDEQGFAATTISDLVTRAGVSRRSFYEHFHNKDECLLATYDAITVRLRRRLVNAAGPVEDWNERLETLIRTLFEAAVDRPDAARLVCVEMGAAGPAGVRRWAEGAARLERFLVDGFARAPGPGTIPNPVARAIVGALRKVLYTRVRQAKSSRTLKAELLKLVPDLVAWIAMYYPSPPGIPHRPHSGGRPRRLMGGRAPGTLSPPSLSGARGLPRGEHNLPRGFVIYNQRERIFDAIANLTAAKGYQALSLEDVAAEAAVSLQTFYTHFANKEDAFLATYEVGHSKAMAIVNQTLLKQSSWIGAVRAGATALLEFLASEPSYAHLACVDVMVAYPSMAGRVHDANASYAELLDLRVGEDAPSLLPGPVVGEAIVGGVFELLHDYILRGRTRRLPELTEHIMYIALTPFLGSEAAWAAIAASDRPRSSGRGAGRKVPQPEK
jgi:AcrR family transcriptional regulator